MHILGIGTEIVECLRIRRMIERHGELFLARVYTEREIRFCNDRKTATEHFASHWAAKAAVLKCLGRRWHPSPIWTEIEICQHPGEPPSIRLLASLADEAEQTGIRAWRLSMAHCRAYATATCLALGAGG